MNADIIKTDNDIGAVVFKYQTSAVSPVYNVTLLFIKNKQGLIKFKMTEETLQDLIKIIQQNLT